MIADGLGSHLVVPGEEDHLHAVGLQFGDGVGAVGFHRVGAGDDAQRRIIRSEIEDGFAVFGGIVIRNVKRHI